MTQQLTERHPILMVPHVHTFGVVIYNNGEPYTTPDNKKIRQAIIDQLPAGYGVSDVTMTYHGVYTPPSISADIDGPLAKKLDEVLERAMNKNTNRTTLLKALLTVIERAA